MYYVMSMATLNANSNVLELTHSEIDNSCSFEIYVEDSSDVIPQKLSVSGTTLSVIFDSKPSRNVECRVLIIKGTGYIDASKVAYERYLWEPWITNVKDALDYFSEQGEITKIDLNTLSDEFNSRVPDDTVLGGVLYHSTTGNTWKKLDAHNLDYDEQSTIYSAMGDIDELETESTNLVGAINEVKNSAEVPTTTGGGTRTSQVTSGTCRWIKIGKLCVGYLYDVKFSGNYTYNDPSSSANLFTGLPKASIQAVFLIRQGNLPTDTKCARLVTRNDGENACVRGNYTTVDSNGTYYGMFAYMTEN